MLHKYWRLKDDSLLLDPIDYYKPNGKRLSQAKLFTVYYISAVTCMYDS